MGALADNSMVLLLLVTLITACMSPAPDSATDQADSLVPVATQNSSSGMLIGRVVIHPARPVERTNGKGQVVGVANLPIRIKNTANAAVYEVNTDKHGWFRIKLAPGYYIVSLRKSGAYVSKNMPTQIEIKSGKQMSLTISLDIGIR